MLFCDFLQRNKIYSTAYNNFISDRQTDLMANLSLFISDQKKFTHCLENCPLIDHSKTKLFTL